MMVPLLQVKGEAGQRYEAVMANQDDESVQVRG